MWYSWRMVVCVLVCSFWVMSADGQSLEQQLKIFSGHPSIQNASWSLTVLSAEDGRQIYGRNSQVSLTPASTLKTVTTSAALGILGEDFKFETLLQYDGYIDESGVLQGNIYIKGGGDPSLGSNREGLGGDMNYFFDRCVAAIKKAGIRKINGSIIGDASIFETATVNPKWQWEDFGNYYGAGAAGLNINENHYRVFFKIGRSEGAPTYVLYTVPTLFSAEIVNEVTTGPKGTGDQSLLYCAPYTDLIYARGTLPIEKGEYSIKGSLPDPALFCARKLAFDLKEVGIETCVGTTTMRIKGTAAATARKLLLTIESAPLSEIVYWANKKSINVYCESLLKMAGYQMYGQGTTEAGIMAVQSYWENKGLNLQGFFMDDGSGLSPGNALTTYQLARLFYLIKQEPYYNVFNQSLSWAGVEDDLGYLRKILKNTEAANNLRAKTGYITRVRGFTGYVTNRSGELMSFAFLVNNFDGKFRQVNRRMEPVLKALAEMK